MKRTDKKFLKGLGKRIKELRESQGISQDQLGYECGMHRTQVNRIENGHLNTGIINLLGISKALSTTINDLFQFEYEKE